jgi:hypothetical protein
MNNFDEIYSEEITITINLPKSVNDDDREGLFQEIINSIEKIEINGEPYIQYDNYKNLTIKIRSLKSYYKVLSLLEITKTIYLNLGMSYRDSRNYVN